MTRLSAILATQRAEAVAELASRREEFRRLVEAAGSTTLDDEHDPEGATIAFERGQFAALIDRAQERLADVDAALARLAAGTYGRCESCGSDIGTARLQARPAARTCITCAVAPRRR